MDCKKDWILLMVQLVGGWGSYRLSLNLLFQKYLRIYKNRIMVLDIRAMVSKSNLFRANGLFELNLFLARPLLIPTPVGSIFNIPPPHVFLDLFLWTGPATLIVLHLPTQALLSILPTVMPSMFSLSHITLYCPDLIFLSTNQI